MKLILLPLSIMTVLILLSLMGFGTEYGFGETELYLSGANDDYYYDVNGVAKLNVTTLLPIDSGENIRIVPQHVQSYPDKARFYNDTNFIHTYYQLYYDSGGQHEVLMKDLGKTYSNSEGGSSSTVVSMDSSFAFIAVVVGISAFSALVGISILGSGESEFSISVIVLFTGFLSLWAILSFSSITLITSIPYGSVFYVVLTLMYTVGCFQQIGSGSSE